VSYASRDPVVFERSHHVSVDAVDYRLTASASKILSPCVVGRRRGSVVQFQQRPQVFVDARLRFGGRFSLVMLTVDLVRIGVAVATAIWRLNEERHGGHPTTTISTLGALVNQTDSSNTSDRSTTRALNDRAARFSVLASQLNRRHRCRLCRRRYTLRRNCARAEQ